MSIKIEPLALMGLLVYLIVVPCIGIIMGKFIGIQKQVMNLRDLRVKRSTEVLSGIKVIKLFSLEKV